MQGRLLIIIFSICFLAGCNYEPEAEYVGPNSIGKYRLGAGDEVNVAVFEQPELSRKYVVNGSGYISMPLAGSVKAKGRTTRELRFAIRSMLGREYVKDPKVSVEIIKYRPFFILGEVKSPGNYSYINNLTVESAVALAGGYTDRADKREVRVTRKSKQGLSTRKVQPTHLVLPGDTIVVNERWF